MVTEFQQHNYFVLSKITIISYPLVSRAKLYVLIFEEFTKPLITEL